MAQRTVKSLQEERRTRRDEIGVVASERAARVEAELLAENRRLREVAEAQAQQLLLLDQKAGGAELLVKREAELVHAVAELRRTIERQNGKLAGAASRIEELQRQVEDVRAAAPLRKQNDAAGREEVLHDQILALETAQEDLTLRSEGAEAAVESLQVGPPAVSPSMATLASTAQPTCR